MMESRILNTIGLSLVLVGLALLYYFGLPPSVDPTGAVRIIVENTEDEEIAKVKRYRLWSQTSIILIAVGLLFQLWATWVP